MHHIVLAKHWHCLNHLRDMAVIIPLASTKLKGGYTGFMSSVRLSVHLSICPSVLPSVCGQNHVCSVSIFGKFLEFALWICLFMTWDLIWIHSMSNHGAARVISERSHSSCSSFKGINIILWMDISSVICKILLRWMKQNLLNDRLTLIYVMAWWHLAITWAKIDQFPWNCMASLEANRLMAWLNKTGQST